MKRILLPSLAFLILTGFVASAQDVALLEERVKQLRGQVDDLLEDRANQKRQLEAMAREIQSLRERVQSQPTGNFATTEDLRALARQVQEIEDKRKADVEFIAKQIENLGKSTVRSPRAETDRGNSPMTRGSGKAIEHTIGAGDTLSTIAAAYSKELGKRITVQQILQANDGLVPERLIPGQKIKIPLP